MREITVELIRRFAPFASRTGHWDVLYFVPGKPRGWHEIEDEYRVLILADPGAGKTFEALTRARKIQERGKKAFFMRIEAAIRRVAIGVWHASFSARMGAVTDLAGAGAQSAGAEGCARFAPIVFVRWRM